MKVFVRTSDLGEEKPVIVAVHTDESDVADNAYGEGITALTVPRDVIQNPNIESKGLASLATGWRERAGSIAANAEATRRIGDVFSVSDQLAALYDLVDLITKHGADVAKWPPEAFQRKRGYDERMKYVNEVRDKTRAHSGAVPRDLTSDKLWPQRPTLKK